MAIPRIGLTSYRETAQWGVWHSVADLLPARYADAIRRAGGAPMILPPNDTNPAAEAEAVLGGLDGLLVAGGADIDPARYGDARTAHCGQPRVDRDAFELALVHAALAVGLPVLGVCRGMQLLNVALGGSLIQHLPDLVGHELHSPTPGAHAEHEVRLAPTGLVAHAMGERLAVATYHHQAVDRLGTGLVPVGWADDDIVEAVELPGPAWVVGVQWHPEVSGAGGLFDDFVAACALERVPR
jgi:putative glutamine amidotransferase